MKETVRSLHQKLRPKSKELNMNFTEYQRLASVTRHKWPKKEGHLADCGLGLAGEAGEVADIIKKHLSASKAMDVEKVKYELGDIMWYIASLCDCLELNMDEVAEANIEKLRKRHGDSYSGYGKREGE